MEFVSVYLYCHGFRCHEWVVWFWMWLDVKIEWDSNNEVQVPRRTICISIQIIGKYDQLMKFLKSDKCGWFFSKIFSIVSRYVIIHCRDKLKNSCNRLHNKNQLPLIWWSCGNTFPAKPHNSRSMNASITANCCAMNFSNNA